MPKSYSSGKAATGGSSGIGNVVGPASAADGDIAAFNGTTGKIIKVSAGIRVDQGGTGAVDGSGAIDNLGALTNNFTLINSGSTTVPFVDDPIPFTHVEPGTTATADGAATGQGTVSATISLGTSVYTVVASGATGNEVNRGANATEYIANIAALIHSDTAGAQCDAAADGTDITLTALVVGESGNDIVIETTDPNLTLDPAFTGGTDATYNSRITDSGTIVQVGLLPAIEAVSTVTPGPFDLVPVAHLTPATGSYAFGANPSDADALPTINGYTDTTFSFVAGAPGSGHEIQIGATLADTLVNTVATIQAWATDNTVPELLALAYASDATHLLFTAATYGTSGNSIPLGASTANITRSGATLAGGGAVLANMLARPQSAVLTADFEKTNDTLLEAVPFTNVPVLEAGQWYRVTGFIPFNTANGGSIADFNGGTATIIGMAGAGSQKGDGFNPFNVFTLTSNIIDQDSESGWSQFDITIQVDTAGTLIPRFAQKVTDALASTFQKYATYTAVPITP